jgi:hypothetical protein
MALTMTLLAAAAARSPEGRYVVWSRIDQKTCLKAISAANLVRAATAHAAAPRPAVMHAAPGAHQHGPWVHGVQLGFEFASAPIAGLLVSKQTFGLP